MNELFRMGPYLQPYRWYLFFGFFTVVLPVAMELVVPRMLQLIIDKGILTEDLPTVWRGSLIMLGAAFVGALMTIAQGVCRAQISQGLAFDLRRDLFAHIQSLSFFNFDSIRTGELMTRISSDVSTIHGFFGGGLAVTIRMILMIIGSVIMLFITDAQLTIIVLVALATAALVIRVLLRITQPIFRVVQKKLGLLNTQLQENLAGVRVIKAFVRERFENNRFEIRNQDYMAENIRVGRLLALALPSLALVTNITLVIVLWRGGLDTVIGRLTAGELIAFTNYLLIGMAPVLMLSNVLTMVTRASVSVIRVHEILATKPSLILSKHPKIGNERRQGEISFKDVVFSYGDPQGWEEEASKPGCDKKATSEDIQVDHGNVLRGVSFEVAAGQQIALMGSTGSGKSTLAHLISRFYDVAEGSVTVGGIDVRNWNIEALRKEIGVVMQHPTLFEGTVQENISYGRPEAPLEEVIAAAKAAQAHGFISDLPLGYDSRVEARGANLSGGQKQRIAIARALLASPSILILDDSTSSVDYETEERIQEALSVWMAKRTTFIVAQRISSVLKADQIYLLDAGRIAASGTHNELLTTSPLYQEIYASQLGSVEDKA